MSGSKIIHPSTGAFGNSGVASKTPRIQNGYKASAAISGPKIVFLSADGTVATMASGSAAITALGVCINSPAAGEIAQVVESGIVQSVPVDGTCNANSVVIRSGTTNGSVTASATPAVGEVLGYAMAASASNTITMRVVKSI